MNTKKSITQKEVKELFHFDKKNGNLVWLSNRGNRAKSGEIAGWIRPDGYRQIGIGDKVYFAHRLIWLYVHGYSPEKSVDHIDRNPLNNKIENLREVSHKCNIRNSRKAINNTSGVKGVSWHNGNGKWRSDLAIDGKQKFLGYYHSFDNAVCARLAGEQCVDWEGCNISSPAYVYVNKNIINSDPNSIGLNLKRKVR